MRDLTWKINLKNIRCMVGYWLYSVLAVPRRHYGYLIRFLPSFGLRCRRYRCWRCVAETHHSTPFVPRAMSTARPVINQLTPFNKYRFDACMNYLMRVYESNLTQHDIAKLHVMTDFFHVLKTGKQAIGGPLDPWKHGPVIEPGFNRVKSMGHRFNDNRGLKPVHQGKLRVIAKKGEKAFLFDPYGEVDDEDFSPAEIESMKQAWNLMMPKTFGEREDYFHNPTNYMGRQWSQAKTAKTGIDWGELVEAYDQQHNTDHTHARLMIDCWRDSA